MYYYNWQIDINKKSATLNIDGESRLFHFNVKLQVYNSYIIDTKRYINRAFGLTSKEPILKFNSLYKKLKVSYFNETLKPSTTYDKNGIKMFHIEDNIFVSKYGDISIFNNGKFYNTDYRTILKLINVNIPVNLVKLTLFNKKELIYNDYTIDTINQTINKIKYYKDENLGFDILSLNNSSVAIYYYYNIVDTNCKTGKDLKLLNILVEALYWGKANYITFGKVKKGIYEKTN